MNLFRKNTQLTHPLGRQFTVRFYFILSIIFLFLTVNLITVLAADSVRIVKIEPSGEVEPNTNFNFTFSSDIVPKSRIGKVMTNREIKFHPALPGKIRWVSPRQLKYLPEAALQPSTAYTVEFKADFLKEFSKTLTGNLKFQFMTERFRVTDSQISFVYNPDQKQGIICRTRLSFNYPVAADNLQRSLTLIFIDKRKQVRFNVSLSNGGRRATIESELLQKGPLARRIELSLPQGFLCIGANIGLKERYVKTADLQERRALIINDINTVSEDGHNIINIQCSEPVDPESVEDFIAIKPKTKLRITVNGETISITGEGLKSGRTYEVIISKGLPSLNGNPLANDFSETNTFPNLEPSVNFNSPGRYLSNKGNLNLGLETINISKVEVEIAKVYANNILSYMESLNDEGYCYSDQLERFGRVVSRQTINVADYEDNEIMVTPINLKEYLSEKRRGVFQVTACDPENRWRRTAKIAVITDLGIMAKMGQDDLIVWINSLDTLQPKSGVKVSLISSNNQEIMAEETNVEGTVTFANLRRELGDFRSYMILAEEDSSIAGSGQETDFSFLRFSDSLIDNTDFGVDGRPHMTDGYEAFLYTDRGVFRPGEPVNLVSIIRGANQTVPPEFPVRLEIVGPDGMVFREYSENTKNNGICRFQIEIPDYARTGKYSARLYVANQSIGTTAFNVEDFMPDRIKVETITNQERYSRNEQAKITIRGTNLFGPPAAGRKADLRVRLEAVPFRPDAYRSYQFGDPNRQFKVDEESLGQATLDANGQAEFTYDYPENIHPPGFIRTIFQATVTEEGGRAVSSYKVVDYHPYSAYIGLKVNGDYYAKVGEAYNINLVEVDPAGKLIGDTTINADIYSVTWNSIYRRDSQGHYTYHSERQETRLGKDSVKLPRGEGSYVYRPSDYGCYKIVFTDSKTGARSAYEFYATGWGYAPWAMDHPDRIQLDLDKPLYKPGETASLQIKAPFSGRALITVEREKVYTVQTVDLKDNTGVISIPIKPEYKPNVYLTVNLIRTVKKLDKRAPTRAYGTIALNTDFGDQRIDLDINTVDEIRPNQTLEVNLTGANLSGPTYLTLAAVDEGICQLTEFQTPDPLAFFFGKRSLTVDTYDLYGMLLPETESITSQNSPAGDEDLEGVRRSNLNPVAIKRVKPVSLWSGLVKLDSEGKANLKLNIPQFNGTLRLMAVAASGPNFGSTTKKILVREPVVMTSTYPRFLAPGDRVVIPVSVYNGTGKNGVFEVKMTASGPVDFDGFSEKSLTLDPNQERTARFAVIARQAIGKCKFILTVKGNDTQTTETTELSIRPSRPATSEAFVGSFTAKIPLELNFRSGWIPGSTTYSLVLAPSPSLKFSGSLRYLLGYPYGCIEQTTSKLFPLLYFKDLARMVEPDLFVGNKVDQYISQGIEKLQSMQMRDGNFSFWPNGDWSYDWGSIYASHFLVEARKNDHLVSDRVYNKMLSYLARFAKTNSKNSWDLQSRVYALYVLSLAGKPQTASMAYIKNQRLADLYPDSRTQLAAAYYFIGDKKTARELLPMTLSVSKFKREQSGNFNSTIRTNAIILSVMADVDAVNPLIPKLIDQLANGIETDLHWGTTQENAFAFMALGKALKNRETPNYEGEVLIEGKSIGKFDSKNTKQFNDPRLGQGKITVKITGAGNCYYYAAVTGTSTKPVPDEAKGISVTREFYDRNGKLLDLKKVKQGELIVAKITLFTTEPNTDNVAIVDLLPAGLEIENPRLASSSRITWLDKDIFIPAYMDIRDDRLILFASFEDSGSRTFYYALRAVSCGTFTLPQIKAECMYAPEVLSIGGGGSMTVVE